MVKFVGLLYWVKLNQADFAVKFSLCTLGLGNQALFLNLHVLNLHVLVCVSI